MSSPSSTAVLSDLNPTPTSILNSTSGNPSNMNSGSTSLTATSTNDTMFGSSDSQNSTSDRYFTVKTTLKSPVTTYITATLPYPAAITTQVEDRGTAYSVTLYPTFINGSVSISDYGIIPLASVAVPSESMSISAHSSKAVPAALGAILGIVGIVSGVLIALLTRRNRILIGQVREERQNAAGANGTTAYAGYGKEAPSEEEGSDQLRQQLSAVRSELAAVNVLSPTTIRDQSDYLRDLTLLNNDVLQLSMRVNRLDSSRPAAHVRSILCSAVWAEIFSKFDPALDLVSERQMLGIEARITNRRSAAIWKAMTVRAIPLASAPFVAIEVERQAREMLGVILQNGVTNTIVEQALLLSRALAEDGKGFNISYMQGGEGFTLVVPSVDL